MVCVNLWICVSGWWMVEYCEKIGWAPASFLVPVDGDLQEEAHTQTSGGDWYLHHGLFINYTKH